MKAIIVPTHDLHRRADILKNCLNSIKTKYKVIVLVSRGIIPKWLKDYDVYCGTNGSDTLKKIYDLTDFDEFFILHDTCEITDNKLWEIVFEKYDGRSVSIAKRFGMLIGKFVRSSLSKVDLPAVEGRIDGYHLYEEKFPDDYKAIEDYITLCPEFTDEFGCEEFKWNRMNHKLICPYIIKWKGNWNIDMCANGGVDSYV